MLEVDENNTPVYNRLIEQRWGTKGTIDRNLCVCDDVMEISA